MEWCMRLHGEPSRPGWGVPVEQKPSFNYVREVMWADQQQLERLIRALDERDIPRNGQSS